MIELGRVSIETKGSFNGPYWDNPCEPDHGYSEFAKVCP